MLPKQHIFLGAIFSLILINYFNFSDLAGFIIWISTFFLIDLDHYFFFVSKTKKYSPRIFWKSWINKEKKGDRYKKPIFFFHGIEPLFVLYLLSFFQVIFYWIFLGWVFHNVSDWIYDSVKGESLLPKISPTITYIKNKNKQDVNYL
jgi:hypothetical protein